MIIKTIKVNGGFFNGQHMKINVETNRFAMVRPKEIPQEYLEQGAKPNPKEKCDYSNVWYRRTNDNNFEFDRETEL